MVWDAVSNRGTMELQVVQRCQNAAGYIGMLERPSPFNERARLCLENRIFQRDNAAIHTVRKPKNFVYANNIGLLDHLQCSPA